ncbi:unnamed protein product, partial [Mesorhabditis belari]|uniref:Potassium channel domain-containing protein n=1 Tax=Mesorhabditis belari TaxID=2138241 RepID=A0AAF3ECR9_9BILA
MVLGAWLRGREAFMRLLMWQNRKAVAVNAAIIVFLSVYTLVGGLVFLHFEAGYEDFLKQNETNAKARCIKDILLRYRHQVRVLREADFAYEIAQRCLMEIGSDTRHEWSYKTAALYGFGILTTLGYGKIEPRTTNGRIFAVIYGFLGIPITVILLTNIGRYLESLAMKIRNICSRNKRDISCNDSITTSTLFVIVVIYLTIGAVCIPLLNGEFDFFNGIYFAFICLTAIEYGDLVPKNNYYVPIVLVYVCIGLAISTIALDIGSMYVRKLHYIGQKLKNIANIKIWFGAKDLRISEFVSAVGANIGIEESILSDIDLENLVKLAIQVKEGRLSRVPQTHMIVEGIWPPALVPLFIKDGQFPTFVDENDYEYDYRYNKKKKSVVRFEDEVLSTSSITEPSSRQISRLSPPPTTDSDRALRTAAPVSYSTSQITTNSWSLQTDQRRFSRSSQISRDSLRSSLRSNSRRTAPSPSHWIDSTEGTMAGLESGEQHLHESTSFDTSCASDFPGTSPSHASLEDPSPKKKVKKPRKGFFKGRPLLLWHKKKNVTYREPTAQPGDDPDTQESLISRSQTSLHSLHTRSSPGSVSEL